MAYIKLEDALQVCSEAEEWYTETNEQQCAVVSDDIYQQIANLPTADVVEVVRCSECEYGKKATINDKGFKICPASGMEITDNDYCSYGERKTDDEQV